MCYNSDMEQSILRFFERLHCAPLTYIFGFFSFLGEGITVAGVVILLYWLWGKAGEQLFFTAISSAAVNSLIKTTALRPRPYTVPGLLQDRILIDTPLFSTVGLGDNLSFPSGHMQASTSALAAGCARCKRLWLRIAAPVLIFLIACSRLYFGVHYFSDVLAGFSFGLIFAIAWDLIFRYAYELRYMILCGLAIVLIPLVGIFPGEDFLMTAALLCGGAVFLPLTALLRYEAPAGLKRLARIPVGALRAGMVYAVFLFIPEIDGLYFLKWFLLAGAATLGANALFKLFKI